MIFTTRIKLETRSDGKVVATTPGVVQAGGFSEVLQINQDYIAIKCRSHAFNPGSRYSGLKTYVPPSIEVYRIVDWLSENEIRVKEAISWDTGRGGNKSVPVIPEIPLDDPKFDIQGRM